MPEDDAVRRQQQPPLGRGSGSAFRAQELRGDIVVGDVTCLFPKPRGAIPCRAGVSSPHAVQATRVDDALAQRFDFQLTRYCSPSPVKLMALDPILSEVALCMLWKGVSSCSRCAHSIDLCPRGALQSHCRHRGVVGAALEEEFELLAGRLARIPVGPADGPDCLFGSYYEEVS